MADRKQLPEVPCIYFAIDAVDQIQYIGRSVNPRQRWQNHHRQPQVKECRIAYMQCDEALLDQVEQALIEWFQPALNWTDVAKTPRRSVTLLVGRPRRKRPTDRVNYKLDSGLRELLVQMSDREGRNEGAQVEQLILFCH